VTNDTWQWFDTGLVPFVHCARQAAKQAIDARVKLVAETATRSRTMSFIAREPRMDRPEHLGAGRAAVLLLVSAAMIGCQQLAAPHQITGEIDDTEIRLAQDRAPAAVRLELTNIGSTPCELVPMLSVLAHDALPVVDGRVVMSLSGDDDRPAPMEAYVELNGERVDREGGTMTEQGWVTRVNPGDEVMLDIGLQGIPDRSERIVVCNGRGDYETGRYAVVAFDR
jgi:hypothetical protein